jgi:hypothetical protein
MAEFFHGGSKASYVVALIFVVILVMAIIILNFK